MNGHAESKGDRRRVVANSAVVYRGPGFDSPPDTEALFGEEADVLEESGSWVSHPFGHGWIRGGTCP